MIVSAFAISMLMQSYASPLAGMWFPFFIYGCAVALNKTDARVIRKTKIWYLSAAWLFCLVLSAFFLAPVKGAAAVLYTLAVVPLIPLCNVSTEKAVKYIGLAIAFYAGCLIVQELLGVGYTNGYEYSGRGWPLVDPNNAALVINAALLPCFHRAIKKPVWFLAVLYFAVALVITDSLAGMGAGFIGCYALWCRENRGCIAWSLPVMAVLLCALAYLRPDFIIDAWSSFATRFPIWEASFPMLSAKTWTGIPFTGVGLGSWDFYYAHFRTEYDTAGWYAHNDILQMAVEVGAVFIPVFIVLITYGIYKGFKHTPDAGAVLLAVLSQSMVEFQFYVVPISIIAGLCLCRINQKEKDYGG